MALKARRKPKLLAGANVQLGITKKTPKNKKKNFSFYIDSCLSLEIQLDVSSSLDIQSR